MKNEFGYIDDRPFKECNTDKQIFSTITIDDEGLEFKINGVSKFGLFDYEEMPEVIYAVDNKLTAITALRINITNSNFSAISSSIIKSDLYFIKQGFLKENEQINHFKMQNKIRELCYYNNSIRRIFFNDSIESKYKLKDNSLQYIKINGKKKKEEKIGELTTNNGNIIQIFLNKDFIYRHQYSGCEERIIKDNSHIVLKFKNGIVFDEAYKYVLLLDSVIYLMTFLKRRHKNLLIKDFKKNSYLCRDMKIDVEDRKVKDRNFLICDKKNSKEIFINLLSNIYIMNNESKNAIFPFLEFDAKQSSLEIQFLEYYKALEYIRFKENERKGKGKNPIFLIEILKENQALKEHFFGSQDESEIEEEIRSLRNYYSHTGYYIDNLQLPIPTDHPKRYKTIDTKWLYDVLKFVKVSAYIEIYKLCGLSIDWNKIIYEI